MRIVIPPSTPALHTAIIRRALTRHLLGFLPRVVPSACLAVGLWVGALIPAHRGKSLLPLSAIARSIPSVETDTALPMPVFLTSQVARHERMPTSAMSVGFVPPIPHQRRTANVHLVSYRLDMARIETRSISAQVIELKSLGHRSDEKQISGNVRVVALRGPYSRARVRKGDRGVATPPTSEARRYPTLVWSRRELLKHQKKVERLHSGALPCR
jgi:hypothetical protein